MAQYYSEVDYCAAEMSRPHAGGGEHYAVRKESYEEVDAGRVDRHRHGGAGHLGGSHSDGGHLGYSGSRHGVHMGGHEAGYEEAHLVDGERRHGHGGRQYDSCTGQYYG
ncbi:uncharacterized protein LOC102719062 [Oryza brachyantha]|uniref:Uncharacterized protein n=1 Tax=Oryza brachyantha TaxID=4533 RepID=J3L700_ORYBR|nr:uncharacterized protein LOC102719062 [Oryza brachyantha]